jgi:two-component system sensor histidine kinase/response regulator
VSSGPFPSLQVEFGPWFWIYFAYALLLQIASLFVFVENYRRAPRIYRRQRAVFLLVFLIPFLPAVIRLAGFAWLIPLEITPLTLTVSLSIAAFFALNTDLFRVAPLARQTVLAQLDAGVMALDKANRLVEINPAALTILGLSGAEIVGQHIDSLAMPSALQAVWTAQPPVNEEIELTVNGKICHYNVGSIPWQDEKGRVNGRFITFTDITARKEAEAAIQRQNIFLNTIIDSLANPFYVINVEDYSIQIANAAARRLGIAARNTCYALTHRRETPCDGLEHPCPLAVMRHSREPVTVEHIHYDADGRPRHMEVHAYPIFNDAGEVIQMIEYSLDITERKQAETQLRQLSRAVEQSGSSIVITDLNGSIEFVNPAFTRITGYTPEEVLGQNPRILKSGRQSEELYRELWQTITRGQVWQGELLNKKKNGDLYWVRATISPVKNSAGVATHYLSIEDDITRQKEVLDAQEKHLEEMTALNNILQALSRATDLRDALQMTTRALAELFDTFQCSITLLNETKDALVVAAQYATRPDQPSVIGVTVPVKGNAHTQQVIETGKPVYVPNVQNDPLTTPETRRILQKANVYSHMILPLLARGEVIGTIGVDIDRPDRDFTEDDIRLAEIVAGQIASIIANARLLDEREQAVQAAEAANKAKSVFLANMSHELRTPMNAILGFAQLLQRDPDLTDNQKEKLATIARSGDHLLTLINDILEMSRIEAGQTSLNPADFDLPQLLDNVVSLLSVKAEEKRLQLSLELPADLPRYIRTDESKLRQILINLTSNAIKFTPAGSVTLSVERRAGQKQHVTGLLPAGGRSTCTLVFKVTDTGIGLSPEEQERIFQPFAQAEGGRRQQGTGLGLAISRHFAALLGGSLDVESAPGAGATFTFDIQAAIADKAAPVSADLPPATGLEPGQPAYRILVVEDNAANLQLLENALTSAGLTARGAEDGRTGVNLARAWRPHLIIMDVTLPGMDGLEATWRIKAQIPNIPIIILTARAFAQDREAAFAAGCDAFMTKPVDMAALFHNISQLTGARFVYAAEAEEPAAPIVSLSPERLAGLPPEIRRGLYEAAVTADRRGVNRLIGRIREKDPALADALDGLAQSFQFDRLAALTEGGNKR